MQYFLVRHVLRLAYRPNSVHQHMYLEAGVVSYGHEKQQYGHQEAIYDV